MARSVLIVLAASVLIVLAWFAFSKNEHVAPAIVPSDIPSASPTSAATEMDTPDVVDSSSTKQTDVERQVAAPSRLNEVTILGRLLRFDRSPAQAAELALRFEQLNKKNEVIATTSGPRTTAGDDGRFRITFAPTSAPVITLEAVLAKSATMRWYWRNLEAGAIVDLGDVVMPEVATLTVRIVDAQVIQLKTGWTVTVETSGFRNVPPRMPMEVRALDPQLGSVTFDDLPSGPIRVHAQHDVLLETEHASVILQAGETRSVDLRFFGHDPMRSVGASALSSPLAAWGSWLSEIVLISSNGHEHVVPTWGPGSSAFLADELDAGPYAIEVRDPRFKPLRVEGVMPGTHVDLPLVGSSAIVLSTSSEDPPQDLSIQLKWIGVDRYGNDRFEFVSKDRPLSSDGRIDGLFTGNIELLARARGRVPTTISIEKLAPGEVRPIKLEFERGGRIAGRVVHADHTGVRDVDVRAALSNEDVDAQSNVIDDTHVPSSAHVRTDDKGHFEFTGLVTGQWMLRATVAPSVQRTLTSYITRTSDLNDVEIVVPALARLTGHVVAPPELPLTKCLMVTRPVMTTEERIAFDKLVGGYTNPRPIGTRLRPDGSFQCPLIQAGEVDVELVLPNAHYEVGALSFEYRGPPLSLDRVTLPPGGELDRTFDVRDNIPMPALVSATVDGAIMPESQIVVCSHGTSFASGSGEIGKDGTTTLSLLPEGKYDVYFYSQYSSWVAVAPNPLVVKLGAQTKFDMNVQRIDGEIEVFGVDKKPLADGARLLLVRSPFAFEPGRGVEDGVQAGRCHFKIPAGSYSLTWVDNERNPIGSTTIDWPGTTRAELEVVKKR